MSIVERQQRLLTVRAVTAAMPRIRGLGVLLAKVADRFRDPALGAVEVSVFGFRMLLSPADYIGNVLIFTPQWYDPKERRFIASILRSGDYVIDVGANIGMYSLLCSRLVGSAGCVTAIEAEQNNADRLTYNLELNAVSNVIVRRCGVSDRNEELSLLLNDTDNAGCHSFLKLLDNDAPRTQTVQCQPLAALVEAGRPVKLMKLDIEGFEHRVLKQFFIDTPAVSWPQYFLIEDNPEQREGDAVRLIIEQGYRQLHRFALNTILVQEGRNST